MKKNCNGCRALGPVGCALGYRTETKRKYVAFFKYFIDYRAPLEQCPKPITYGKFYIEKSKKDI